MIVGECSGLVSCPAEIREGARGATWRHRDQREGGYSPLCTPPTPIQHRYCAAAIIVGGGQCVVRAPYAGVPVAPLVTRGRLAPVSARTTVDRALSLRDIYKPTH